MSQTAEGASWWGLAGGVLGVLTAAALGWTVFRGGTRLSVRHFFAATSVVLLLIAAGLFSTGLGKLQALGVLPVTDALWDSSALLSDHSLVGGFATGLVGYRANPPTRLISAGHRCAVGQLGAAERSQSRRWVRDGARRLSRASDARRGHGLHAVPDHCRRALPRRTARDRRTIRITRADKLILTK